MGKQQSKLSFNFGPPARAGSFRGEGNQGSSNAEHNTSNNTVQSSQSSNYRFFIEDPSLEMHKKIMKDLEFSHDDFKTGLLAHVFEGNWEMLEAELTVKSSQGQPQQYEQDLVLVFWLAVHLERLEIAANLVAREDLVRKLVACINLKDRQVEESDDEEEDYGDEEVEAEEEYDEEFDSEIIESSSLQEATHSRRRRRAPRHNPEYGEEVQTSYEFSEEDSGENEGDNEQSEEDSEEEEEEDSRRHYEGGESTTKKDTLSQSEAATKKESQGPGGGMLSSFFKELQAVQKQQFQEAAPPNKEHHHHKKDSPVDILEQYLGSFGLSMEEIDIVEIHDMEDLQRIKQHLRTDQWVVMTKILKLVQKRKHEQKLAWVITVEHEISLDVDLLYDAVSKENFQWLFYVWATRKNYLGNRSEPQAQFITFEQLFDMIIKICGNGKDDAKVEANIKLILDWKITPDEKPKNNIIRCLLAHHLDVIAVDYMGLYNRMLNKDLLIYCIDHGNNYFLQKALLLAAFDKMLFREEQVVSEILTILRRGYCTNFILNIISLIDISVWKNQRLTSLIEIIRDYEKDDYHSNRLLLSANPLLSIALACEILIKIADARRKYESECYQIMQNMLRLGQMYSKKIEDEAYYESIIMSKDFNDRSIIKIITQNNFEALMDENDPKAERVMMMIWQGKEASHCDGDVQGYSSLVHVLMSKKKKVLEKQAFMQIVTNFFQPNGQLNYAFQYRFRTVSIQFYFYKELLCALLMLIIFQYINYRYLILFSNKVLKQSNHDLVGNSTEPIDTTNSTSIEEEFGFIVNINASIQEYVDWNFWALFFSAALIFQHVLKIVFNICSPYRIGADKWTIMDTASALLNIIAVVLIQEIDPATFLNPKRKDLVDYFMLLVLCVSWLRFFSYFLVVRSISKLLLTLIEMIGDTLSFLFLVSCFILIMSSVFATLYQDTNPEKYGGLAKTVTTLFNGVVAQYSYDDDQMVGRMISHSFLTIFHVFFTNILLMNYLIAILSSTYGKMRESGIFSFKVNLYQYCERYLTAFNDRAYGELVMHPPPLSYLSGLLLPFLCSRKTMERFSKAMSYIMYWVENIVYIIFFGFFELLLSPLAFAKIWYNMLQLLRNQDSGSLDRVRSLIYFAIWSVFGPVVMCWLMAKDVRNFFIILIHHDGFTRTMEEKNAANKADDALKVQVYNEVRALVISLFLKIVRQMEKEGAGMNDGGQAQARAISESEDDDDLDRIPDFFIIEDQILNTLALVNDETQYFIVKKYIILEEWKKRRMAQERRSRMKAGDFSSSNDAKKNIVHNRIRKSIYRSLNHGKDDINSQRTRRQSLYQNQWDRKKQNSQTNKGGEGPLKRDLTTHFKGALLDNINKFIKIENQKKDFEFGIDMSEFVIPEEEERLVIEFLNKFVVMAESGNKDHIDIKLLIKALPNKIMSYSLETIDMFNFRIFQESLHAYQNLAIVKAFEYFDDKNKQRVQVVKNKLAQQKEVIDDASSLLEIVKETLDTQYPELTATIEQQQSNLQRMTTVVTEGQPGQALRKMTSTLNRGNTITSKKQMLMQARPSSKQIALQQALINPSAKTLAIQQKKRSNEMQFVYNQPQQSIAMFSNTSAAARRLINKRISSRLADDHSQFNQNNLLQNHNFKAKSGPLIGTPTDGHTLLQTFSSTLGPTQALPTAITAPPASSGLGALGQLSQALLQSQQQTQQQRPQIPISEQFQPTSN